MTSNEAQFDAIPNAEVMDTDIIECPVMVLPNQVVYPEVFMPIVTDSDESEKVVAVALEQNQTVIVIAERPTWSDDPGWHEDAYDIGTEVAVGKLHGLNSQPQTVLVQGRRRVEVIEVVPREHPYAVVRARVLQDKVMDRDALDGLTDVVVELFRQCVEYSDTIPEEIVEYVLAIEDYGHLADVIASTILNAVGDRQTVLEHTMVDERLDFLRNVLQAELNRLETREELNSHVHKEMAKVQREMYLREQLRVIQDELGEGDIFQQEIVELKELIDQADMPDAVYDKASKELSRLSIMAPMSPESGVIRSYLDWLLAMPWNNLTDDRLDVAYAEQVLNEDHYGLKKVKDRILEYIAVRKLAQDKMKSPILCFVGPPGVGKTSLGRSIARALGREFVRVSLGGVRDEAEIRGHRRTYIGALPGRVIQTIRRAKTLNPVIMLDEIDKLGADFRGDPSSALLEVLDPEQNFEFSDHYLEVPFDLSKVLFITTANELYTIPPALEDRMEIIEFRGYTEEEKIKIAEQFLLPKQIEAHGLAEHGIRMEVGALQTLIREYTHEAGVRNFEREIANVVRKIARQVAMDKKSPKRVTAKQVNDYLGPPYYIATRANKTDSVGIATGLVWTSAGGDVQTIEISLIPGKGNVILTGQLGDVLQESAQAAMTYLRSRADEYGVPHDDFENYDLHLHMPEGAVPKDGPSAGITLAVAMISAFTERPVRSDFAMTGEVTLRGHVLPIGGTMEKVLAARRNHILDVIIPLENQKDLVELPKPVLKSMNVHMVETMEQVLDLVLLDAPKERERDMRQRERDAETEKQADDDE